MDWINLVSTYGYVAVFLGAMVEGETILIVAGFLANAGYLSLVPVILASWIGAFAGDQLFFFLGRLRGKAFLQKRPKWRVNTDRIHRAIERYQTLVILGFRFMYGFRIITPIVLGTSSVRTSRFVLLNIGSGLIWATVIGSGGYLFGRTFEAIMGNVKHYTGYIVLGIFAVGLLLWLAHSLWRKRTNRQAPKPQDPAA